MTLGAKGVFAHGWDKLESERRGRARLLGARRGEEGVCGIDKGEIYL